MSRYTLLVSALACSALLAWGCGGSNSARDNAPTVPSITSDTDAPAPSPGADDDDAARDTNAGEGRENIGSTDSIDFGTSPDNAGGNKDSVKRVTNCDGEKIVIPSGSPRGLFDFGNTTADANNLTGPFEFAEGRENGEITFDRGTWTIDAIRTSGEFAFALSGAGTLGEETFAYNTLLNFSYGVNNSCGQLYTLQMTHIGHLKEDTIGPIYFSNPLSLTGNRFVPEAGESHMSYGVEVTPVGQNVAEWTATVVEVWTVGDQDFTRYEFSWNDDGGKRDFELVWLTDSGIVAVEDPFFPGGPLLVTFPGYVAP